MKITDWGSSEPIRMTEVASFGPFESCELHPGARAMLGEDLITCERCEAVLQVVVWARQAGTTGLTEHSHDG